MRTEGWWWYNTLGLDLRRWPRDTNGAQKSDHGEGAGLIPSVNNKTQPANKNLQRTRSEKSAIELIKFSEIWKITKLAKNKIITTASERKLVWNFSKLTKFKDEVIFPRYIIFKYS